MPVVDLVPEQTDIFLQQGSDLVLPVRFEDASGAAINLTGCSFVGQIRRSLRSSTVIASLIITPIDLVDGRIRVSLPGSVTSSVDAAPCGIDLVYDVELTDSLGAVSRPLWGRLILNGEVTRA